MAQDIDDNLGDWSDLVSIELFSALTDGLNAMIDGVGVGEIATIMDVSGMTPPLDPTIWQECNGSLITEPNSPLRNQYTPNMSNAIARESDLAFRHKTLSGATLEFLQYINIPAVTAARNINSVNYVADTTGAGGNAITIEMLDTYVGTGNPITVSVAGNAITINIDSYFHTDADVASAVNSYGPSAALVNATDSGGWYSQSAFSPMALVGGVDQVLIGNAGAEVVSVVGTAISIRFQSGVSTTNQIKAALQASPAAMALIEVTGGSGATASAPIASVPFSHGMYLKGCATISTSGLQAGINTKNFMHNHTGATGGQSDPLQTIVDASDGYWEGVDHVHGISSDLSYGQDVQPAFFTIKHYLKIR